MKKETIWLLFDRLRPIIVEKLINPEVLETPRGRMFFYDGIKSDDDSWTSSVAQLIVPLNDEDAKILSPDEYFTAQESEYHNVWYVYPDREIPLPWDGWQANVIISLKTYNQQNYMLCISLVCYGINEVASHGQVMTYGNISQITQAVKSDKFSSNASGIFTICIDGVASEIEESERHNREKRLFAVTDITDYDSVMKFVDSVKSRKLLKSKGRGLELFTYDGVKLLINRDAKSTKLLVDRNGKAQFCSLGDFPDELLKMIRMEKNDWDLSVHELSVGSFSNDGLSFVTWVISPYFYCPMDEDGFGEEEGFEVAVTCHIDTNGRLADTPVWKPYTGPRR